MKDFNIAKYLRENHLGSHAILGKYVDLHSLKEDMDYDRAQASAEDWFDEYEEEGRLDDLYGMSVKELIDALKLFGEPDAEKVAPILHKMINSEADVEESLDKEEMYLDTEIPYEGPEHKLDGFGDGFVQDSPVEEAGKDDKDSLMSKLFAIQKKYGYKKARPDQEEYENVRIAPTVARVGNKIVEDGGIAISIESKVSKAAFTDIKNLLQSKFPGWKIDPQSVTKDDDFDTDSKNVLFFDIIKNQPVKENGVEEEVTVSSSGVEMEEAESMDYDDSVNPFPSLNRMGGYSDEQDKFDRMLGLSHEYIGKVSPIVRKTINSLRDDGFDDKDIIDFLASDLS
jgi:hypothetical protein